MCFVLGTLVTCAAWWWGGEGNIATVEACDVSARGTHVRSIGVLTIVSGVMRCGVR